MNYWHLIYTPKHLKDLSSAALPYERYCASNELGEGGRHWHIFIVTDHDETTIRDRLKAVQDIPNGKRGKKNIHYSLRPTDEHHPDFPQQDLRKFVLGYTLKEQTIEPADTTTFRAGYTNEELIEAQEYYFKENAAAQKRAETMAADRAAVDEIINKPTADESIQEQWLDYVMFIEKAAKTISVCDQVPITIPWLYSQSRKYWREKSNGLFPQASKYKRFLGSIIDKLRARIVMEARMEAMKNLGY